jgi:Reverse transcriptase (RNA-dependent DNA polymerase)
LCAEIIEAHELGPIPIRLGLKQGCPCSPMLFSLYFDRVEKYVREEYLREYGSDSSEDIRFLSLQLVLLLFADDVALLART